MALGFDLSPDLFDLSVLIDKKGRAFDAKVFLAVQRFLDPKIKRIDESAFGIGEDRIVEF